jgi:cytochrome P450
MTVQSKNSVVPSSKTKLLEQLFRQLRGASVTLPVLLLGFACLLAWFRRRFARKVPYVRGVPVFGVLPDVVRSLFSYRLHDLFDDWHQQLGQTWASNLFGVSLVSTHDPKNLEHILKHNFDNYVKGTVFTDPFTDLLGDGIFNVDGEKWYHQRKTASRMFTKKVFETRIWQVLQGNTAKVHQVLERSAGQELCLFNLMNRFTLDTIGEIGFSRDIGSIEDPSSPFLKSFDYVQSALAKRAYTSQTFPTFKVVRAFNGLWEKEMPMHLKLLDDYCSGIVEDLIKKVSEGDDSSFVGLFAKDDEGQQLRQKDEAGFRRYMRDMVLNFIIAGRDTTAQNLTWTFFELCQRPEVVQRIRKEVKEVCGEAEVGYGDVSRLQYIRAVVDESLRLHPSVPFDIKMAVADDVFPDGTVIKAGSRVGYAPFSQGRDKTLWGQDACDFRPERWQEMPRRPSPYEFVAFNAGKRECLGKRLAEMEMVTLVANLVRRFDFELLVKPQEIHYDIQLTLGCSSGLPVRVTPVA